MLFISVHVCMCVLLWYAGKAAKKAIKAALAAKQAASLNRVSGVEQAVTQDLTPEQQDSLASGESEASTFEAAGPEDTKLQTQNAGTWQFLLVSV